MIGIVCGVFGGNLVHMRDEMVEELGDHDRRLRLLVLCVAMGVEVVEEEGPHAEHRLEHVGAHGDVARLGAVRDDVVDHGADALRRRGAEDLCEGRGKRRLAQDARAFGIVDVVHDVGDAVGKRDDAALERDRGRYARVAADAVDGLEREVEALAVALEQLDDADALQVVPEEVVGSLLPQLAPPPRRHRTREGLLAAVAERRMAEVVPERDRLGKVLVQGERAGDGAGDLGYLEGVREARAVVVALGCEEDLRLMREPPEALAVKDAVAVALEGGAVRIGFLVAEPAQRRRGACRIRREQLPLAALEFLACHLMHRMLPVKRRRRGAWPLLLW